MLMHAHNYTISCVAMACQLATPSSFSVSWPGRGVSRVCHHLPTAVRQDQGAGSGGGSSVRGPSYPDPMAHAAVPSTGRICERPAEFFRAGLVGPFKIIINHQKSAIAKEVPHDSEGCQRFPWQLIISMASTGRPSRPSSMVT